MEEMINVTGKWLSMERVAAALDISTRTLHNWHQRGEGPPVYKLGEKTLRYREDEVMDWLRSRRS